METVSVIVTDECQTQCLQKSFHFSTNTVPLGRLGSAIALDSATATRWEEGEGAFEAMYYFATAGSSQAGGQRMRSSITALLK